MMVLSFSSFLFSSALATLSEAALGFFKTANDYQPHDPTDNH